jgi:hypothetical protein
MQPHRKRTAVNFRALAKELGKMARGAPARSAEDVAFDYHDAAERAGALLVEAHRRGLLPKVPGLARLVNRDLDPALLFRQFHGYEVNTAVLLSGCREPQPRDAALTCGLLPQLLPAHPVFRPRSYRGATADTEAVLAELRRAAEACKWLAAQIGNQGGPPPAPDGKPGRKTTAKALADFADTRRSRETKTTWKEIAAQWLAKHPGAAGADGNPLTWRHVYHAWRKHYG